MSARPTPELPRPGFFDVKLATDEMIWIHVDHMHVYIYGISFVYVPIYICIFTCMLATCIFILVVFCLEFVEFFQCHELLLASWTRKLFLTFKSR